MDALAEFVTMTLTVATGLIILKLALSVVHVPVVSNLVAMI